jgi:hypothetical protein
MSIGKMDEKRKDGMCMEVLLLIYLIAGYWAAGVIFFENKVVIHAFGALFMRKLILGMFLGIVLIPAAIIKRVLFR